MPQVPYSGAPSVGAELNPSPILQVNPPAEAFDAASAEARRGLGRTIEHAADEIFTRAYALQQLDNQADASNGYSKLVTESGKRFADYEILQGKAAKDGYDSYIDGLTKLREEIGNKLGSEEARKAYDSQSRPFLAHNIASASRHMATQNKNYLIGTEQSRIDAGVAAVGMSPGSDDLFKAELGKVDTSAMQHLKGWSPEQAQEWALTEKSKLVQSRVMSLANKGEAKAAQEVLDAAIKDGYIASDVAGNVGNNIRQIRNNITSRVESAKLLDGEGFHFGKGKVAPERLAKAIASVESSGNYSARGPVVVSGSFKGQVALGKYQIMQGNLQPWLKEAGMPSMTEAEFLADHSAQDKLAAFKLGQYQDKYGSANEAARHWRGLGDVDPTVNETAGQYLKKFNKALAGNATTAEVRSVSESRASEIDSEDALFKQTFVHDTTTVHNRDLDQQRQEKFNNMQTIEEAMESAPDGRLPTSIQDNPDPKVQEAWSKLDPKTQNHYQEILAQNFHKEYGYTEENQREYRKWVGRMVNPQSSEEDRRAAFDADFLGMKLPWNQRKELNGLRRQLFAGKENPAMGHAMQVLGPMVRDPALGLDKEDIDLFRGSLHEVLQTEMSFGNNMPNDEQLKIIGTRLLRQVKTGPWYWKSQSPQFKVEIPERIKDSLTQKYVARYGSEPTEQQLQILYNAMQFQDLYGKRVQVDGK